MASGSDKSRAGRPKRAWYAGGLRFECQPDCGGCCTSHGDYVYVYLEPGESRRLADFLGLTVEEFQARYTSLDDGERILKMEEPDCPFLEDTRCTVYPARPVQCRTFPFWSENLTSRRKWNRIAGFCPGIGKGPLVPLAAIRGDLAARRRG